MNIRLFPEHRRKVILSTLSLGACIFLALPSSAPAAPTFREGIEWVDIWIAHANENKLPRVLLIGDSITRAYSEAVDKKLEGKAYVARLATSHFLNDPMLLAQITTMLDNVKFDVIQFNNGMHGWQYTEEDYRKYFPAFLATIRKHAPTAKLIWATTTPRKGSSPAAPDARVAARNAIALEFVTPLHIPVDDLYRLVDGHPEYHDEDVVHFNRIGQEVQATQVAAEIEKLLKSPIRE
jgi:hypothetical protein